jgi:hypothetical protein
MSGGFGLAGRWAAAEVAVAEALNPLEAEDFGAVDEPVDHRGSDHPDAEDLAALIEPWADALGYGAVRRLPTGRLSGDVYRRRVFR